MSSWFDTKSFASLAKSALSQAQKQIDKALEAVADEESDSDDSEVSGLDPFGSGWAIRKPKMKKEAQKGNATVLNSVMAKAGEGHLKQGDSSSGLLTEDKVNNSGLNSDEIVVTNQIRQEPNKPVVEANPVTSQIKATPDSVIGPVIVQVRSQKATDNTDRLSESSALLGETSSKGEDCQTGEEDASPTAIAASATMGTSSESVETTVQQGSDLDFSMLEEAKDETCGSGGNSGDGETAASSDIEIISAINSTPSEALHHDQSALWDDALTDALRELSGEIGVGAAANATAALETLLHAREQKVMALSGDNARLTEDNEKLRERVAQLEARNLEACRNSSEQVQQLLAEGDKLAREVLEKANSLKRLRAKEREQDELVRKHTKNIDELNVQLERLRRSLSQKDVQEKLHIEQIRELKAAKITAADLKMQLDVAKSRCRELEERNAKVLMESKVMTASVEMSAQDQLRSGMAELKARHSEEIDSLRQKVAQLELQLKKAEVTISQNEQHGRGLRQEVLALQERNQELTESLALATAPYVRELDKMKTVCDNERKSFENEIVNLQRVVETLRQKTSDLEDRLKVMTKDKQVAEFECHVLSERMAELEKNLQEAKGAQLSVKTVDTATLEYIEVLKGQLVEREDAITKMNQSIELLRSRETSLQQKILTLERSVEFERQKSRLEGHEPRPVSPTASNRSSLASSVEFEKNDNYATFTANLNSPSVIDNMSSQLKLKDGQMQQLRVEVNQLKRSRDTLSNQMTEMTMELEKYKQAEVELADLPEKYEALLQMYGELVEKNDELRLDLEEARTAYRAQLQELTARLKRNNV
ncbi:TATA element modulatory factor-like isoform X2 [Varroa jacobsoni]|uniref:TATA element modulatory factor 1 TATA binding domain-containing protein n=1 Tax=Varroa destructor TaxID=109461 RepID=A0A7M7JRK8_VARDE|nr:TATA element modulatory factor-like isoform X2 [Varroa destructor]XP_022693305.1 TATA element modulatory factor-like isoform X2 [Varroa jacobsoni]